MSPLRFLATLLITGALLFPGAAGLADAQSSGRAADGAADPSADPPPGRQGGARSAVEGPSLAPMAVREEELNGVAAAGEPFPLSPEAGQRLLAEGGVLLALDLADQALQRGGAPVTAARWLAIKTAAHLRLGQYAPAANLLEGKPEAEFQQRPDLLLMLADAQMGLGRFPAARQSYAKFLLYHPDHPERFRVQRNVGLCALQMGALDEAGLQLGLYAEERGRPKPDPLLIAAQTLLAQREGLARQVDAGMRRLRRLEGDAGWENRVDRMAWRLMRAQLFAELEQWPEALVEVERLLEEGRRVEILGLHARLFRQWLAASEASLGGGGRSASACSLDQQRVWDQWRWLRTVTDHQAEPMDREAALESLLELELHRNLGLLETGGLLSPASLGLAEPIPGPLRILYAEAYHRLRRYEMAARMLEGVDHPESDALRVLLLAHGFGAEALPALADRLLADGGVRLWPAHQRARLVNALFLYTERGDPAAVNRLRELLSLFGADPAIQRALRFHQGWALAGLGERRAALIAFLALAYDEASTPELNRYLPADPRLAAADILEGLGATDQARQLRRAVRPPPRSRAP